jgi:hypothetical protein
MEDMDRLEEILIDLGFQEQSIVETILTTYNMDGTLNAAPMGIARARKNSYVLEFKPFKSSTTYNNIKLSSAVCLNITSNPKFFLATAFKKFVKTQPNINEDLSISGCDASIYGDIISIEDTSDFRVKACIHAKRIEVWNPLPKVFSRGSSEAIEAVIHATRLYAFRNSPRSEEYLRRIRNCFEIIQRVSSEKSSEADVMMVLKQLSKKWGYIL